MSRPPAPPPPPGYSRRSDDGLDWPHTGALLAFVVILAAAILLTVTLTRTATRSQYCADLHELRGFEVRFMHGRCWAKRCESPLDSCKFEVEP